MEPSFLFQTVFLDKISGERQRGHTNITWPRGTYDMAIKMLGNFIRQERLQAGLFLANASACCRWNRVCSWKIKKVTINSTPDYESCM